MCTSVWPGRYAGVAAHDTHVLARIYAGHEDLVRYAAACKCAKGVDKGYESLFGKAGRHAEHIGFLDPAVNDFVRVCCLEPVHARGCHQVSVQPENPVIGAFKFNQGVCQGSPHIGCILFHAFTAPFLRIPFRLPTSFRLLWQCGGCLFFLP